MRHTTLGLAYKLVEKEYDSYCLVCGAMIDQICEVRIKTTVGELPEQTYAFPTCSTRCGEMWAELISRTLRGDAKAARLATSRMVQVGRLT